MSALSTAVPDLPHVWRGGELASGLQRAIPSGHAALDAELPGGGWPLGCLVEILPEKPERFIWQLLLPGLLQRRRESRGPIVLVSPPYLPFGPSLAARGLTEADLLLVQPPPTRRGWTVEQALRCGEVAAVVAWLPVVTAEELRRLQLSAQKHEQLFFAVRPVRAADSASPARLRLGVAPAEGPAAQADAMQVRVLKRRGPPLLDPVLLPAWPEPLQRLLAARNRRGAGSMGVPARRGEGRSHGLDRTAALAG